MGLEGLGVRVEGDGWRSRLKFRGLEGFRGLGGLSGFRGLGFS